MGTMHDSSRLEEVKSASLAQAIGPFSHALVGKPNGRLVSVSGQGGFDKSGRLVAVGSGAISAQADQAFANIRSLLESAGGSMESLMSVTVYLKSAASYGAFNEVRRKHLSSPFPTSTTVADIGFVVEGMEIEISALAIV